MKDIELIINDEENEGVFAISLVDKPAIKEDFIYLSQHEVTLKVIDEEKRELIGVALVPNKKIYRCDDNTGEEWNIFFSEKTVEKTQECFMKELNLSNITSQHERKVTGVNVIESWIVEDPKQDKSNIYNLNAVKGSWIVKLKVYNENEWQRVKNGEYKGFSIEGKFSEMEVKASIDIVEEIKQIIE